MPFNFNEKKNTSMMILEKKEKNPQFMKFNLTLNIVQVKGFLIIQIWVCKKQLLSSLISMKKYYCHFAIVHNVHLYFIY